MNMKYHHKWDKEHGLSICTIEYNGFKFYGYAQCCPEDEEFKSEMTGGNISTWRAEVAVMKHIKRCEIEPKIAALRHVYFTMAHSKQYNPKSYEARRLFREYQNLLDDLDEINAEIKDTENLLKDYIESKDRANKARKQ
jgi:hypothetical protein